MEEKEAKKEERNLLQVGGGVVKHAHPDKRLREEQLHVLAVPPRGGEVLQEEHDVLEFSLAQIFAPRH